VNGAESGSESDDESVMSDARSPRTPARSGVLSPRNGAQSGSLAALQPRSTIPTQDLGPKELQTLVERLREQLVVRGNPCFVWYDVIILLSFH
jgi:hypothetical protein